MGRMEKWDTNAIAHIVLCKDGSQCVQVWTGDLFVLCKKYNPKAETWKNKNKTQFMTMMSLLSDASPVEHNSLIMLLFLEPRRLSAPSYEWCAAALDKHSKANPLWHLRWQRWSTLKGTARYRRAALDENQMRHKVLIKCVTISGPFKHSCLCCKY